MGQIIVSLSIDTEYETQVQPFELKHMMVFSFFTLCIDLCSANAVIFTIPEMCIKSKWVQRFAELVDSLCLLAFDEARMASII